MAEVAPLLVMSGVTKRFGAVVALDGVALRVGQGEVHALVGENGAGKSSLMKVLAGAHAADGGKLELAGSAYQPRDPLAARRRGVAMIYQELSLAPDLSVTANVLLGREDTRFGCLRTSVMRERVAAALEFLDHAEIAPERRVAELGPGARQLVEVARALVSDAQLIVMDEPTSSLSAPDVQRLFAVIRRLRERQVSVIYISHALEEVFEIADRYTVLRDGKSVASGAIADTTREQLIEAMVGRRLEQAFPRTPHAVGEPLLELRGLTGLHLPRDASLTLRRGEILGLSGLVGAGRTELLRALFGLDPVLRGEVKIAGLSDRGRPPWVRLAQRVGLLSEARKEEGLAVELSIAENITLPTLGRSARFGFVQRARQRSVAERFCTELGVRCDDVGRAVGKLSGGNQQKVALARLLACDADVLLLDEPTRGIDVGSKAEIYRAIGALAAAGKAVLWVSSYLPELLGVCDTLAVLHRGQLGAARPVAAWTEAEVLREATGVA
ncbi:MAG TPA: sugar ABC transporter ATP-binding protein [Polyangiales bacterium]|nr:sugar ABC transporter ATP-binding protein [Polyangiales bacterium]